MSTYPHTTKAVRIQPTDPAALLYTPVKPAPPSAIYITDLPTPTPSHPTQLLVRNKATTIIRDNLSWPELYAPSPAYPGNDFAGIVAAVHSNATHAFKPGDEVYGMAHAHRGGTWADYVLVEASECTRRPSHLPWAEAAALPLSALTADQALFAHAGLALQAREGQAKRVLVTGAAGGVGMLVVSFASAAGYEVVGATSKKGRDEGFLFELGAKETIEYASLSAQEPFDAVVDTVGGEVLRSCWDIVSGDGVLISVDSASWDFVREHEKVGVSEGKEDVKAAFFIVEPDAESLRRVGEAVERSGLRGVVARTMPFERVGEAYEVVQRGEGGRGKVVLVFG
ncbi:hypothetical protein Q7P37_010256 [Cladosporium fusiforme]